MGSLNAHKLSGISPAKEFPSTLNTLRVPFDADQASSIGIVPVNELLLNQNMECGIGAVTDRVQPSSNPSSLGIWPVNLLFSSHIIPISGRRPNSLGIGPEKELSSMSRNFKDESLPISLGIVPVKKFLYALN